MHNLAKERTEDDVQANYDAFLQLMRPVLRKKRYSAILRRIKPGTDCLYEIILSHGPARFTQPHPYRGPGNLNADAEYLTFMAFLDDMKTAVRRIKPRWKTTFIFNYPENSRIDRQFECNFISIKVIQF